jgi:hypothetical protein
MVINIAREVVMQSILLLVIFPLNALAFSGDGSGTSGDPYQISNCNELQEMKDDLSADYILVNDIDCAASNTWNSGAGYIPAGTSGSRFTGSLDGQNYSITDLFIDRGSTDFIGLFAYTNRATIENVRMADIDFTGRYHVAALIGIDESYTHIENCAYFLVKRSSRISYIKMPITYTCTS